MPGERGCMGYMGNLGSQNCSKINSYIIINVHYYLLKSIRSIAMGRKLILLEIRLILLSSACLVQFKLILRVSINIDSYCLFLLRQIFSFSSLQERRGCNRD